MIEKTSKCFNVKLINENLFHWEINFNGPDRSPYQNGFFRLDIRITSNYPIDPPKIKFITKIYHPNIHLSGRICLDILTSNWNSNYSIQYILLAIYSLLNDPNPDDPLNKRAANFYKNNHEKYNQIAQWWTKNYAHQ